MTTQNQNWTPIEVLYADCYRDDAPHSTGMIPVVRYADHCASVENLQISLESMCGLRDRLMLELKEKEEHRACAIRRNDELIKQLERLALLCEEQAAQIRNLHPSPVAIAREVARWDGKPKAL